MSAARTVAPVKVCLAVAFIPCARATDAPASKVSSTIPRFSATDRRRRWGCLLTTARSKVHTNFLSRYYCEYHQRSKQTRRIGTRLPMHFINQIQRRKRGDWISTISVVSGNHSI